MSKDKSEEKAREYAGVTPDVKDISQLPPYFYVQRQKYKDYLAGYTQSEQGLSAENEKLKEALREVISRYDILERSVMVHPYYVFGDDNDEWLYVHKLQNIVKSLTGNELKIEVCRKI